MSKLNNITQSEASANELNSNLYTYTYPNIGYPYIGDPIINEPYPNLRYPYPYISTITTVTSDKPKEDDKLFIDQWNGLNWPYKAIQNVDKNRIEVHLLDEKTNKLGKMIFKVYSVKTLNEIKMVDI